MCVSSLLKTVTLKRTGRYSNPLPLGSPTNALPLSNTGHLMPINTTFFIFQDGGRPPSWIFKSLKFQLLVWFGGPICVIVPNVVPIGQTVAEIQPFWSFFSGWRPSAIFDFWFLKVGNFKRWTCLEGQYAWPCQISCRSVKPLLGYRDFCILKCHHLGCLSFKFETVRMVKKVKLRHWAKFRQNLWNRDQDMAICRTNFPNDGLRHVGFLKLQISNCGTRHECRIALPCKISWQPVKPLPRYRNFWILGWRPPPSWIFEI